MSNISEKCHPSLKRERENCNLNKELLTNIIDGSPYLTEVRREVLKIVLNEPELKTRPNFHYLSRNENYNEAIRKSRIFLKILKQNDMTDIEAHYLNGYIFCNETSPILLHSSLFSRSIDTQADDNQKTKWMPKINNYEILGTYVQTELGHGTNIKGLETTATFNEQKDEFILHSPTLTSIKWWPGGLGKTCNYAVVMAQLVINSKQYGVHPFIVQLRDHQTHKTLPGLEIGDIGPKLGFQGMDNGYLRFNQFPIARENMLMRTAQVDRKGNYTRKNSLRLIYGAMVFVRAMLVFDQSAKCLAQAVTIATRYSFVRRQSEYEPGGEEPEIIEYQVQQMKLFGELARAYVFFVGGNKLREFYFKINYEITSGNLLRLPELHAISAGLKALTLDEALLGVENCRILCGGHGYSAASNFNKIYAQVAAAAIYEGIHPVLYLQTARFLVKITNLNKKSFFSFFSSFPSPSSASSSSTFPFSSSFFFDDCTFSYLFHPPPFPTLPSLDFFLSNLHFLHLFQLRSILCLKKANKQLEELLNLGKPHHVAWNMTSCELITAAQAHSQVFLISSMFDKVKEVSKEDEEVGNVLRLLFRLYCINSILNNGHHFLEASNLTFKSLEIMKKESEKIISSIKPLSVCLVDAFDFPDFLLDSCLGRYDGRVYEALFDWATKSPLNQSDVHSSFHQFIKPTLDFKIISKL